MLPLFSPHHHTPPSLVLPVSALCRCLTHFSSGVSGMSSTRPTEKGIRELFDPLFACTVSGIVSDGVLKRKQSTEQAGRQSADDHSTETVLFSCLTKNGEQPSADEQHHSVATASHLCRVVSSGCVWADPPHRLHKTPPLKKPRSQRLWFRHLSLSSSSGPLGGGPSNLKGTHKDKNIPVTDKTQHNPITPPPRKHQNL